VQVPGTSPLQKNQPGGAENIAAPAASDDFSAMRRRKSDFLRRANNIIRNCDCAIRVFPQTDPPARAAAGAERDGSSHEQAKTLGSAADFEI
jgi:hypothetical protein